MEQYIFDEGNGLWYERSGDYSLPVPAGAQARRYLGTAVPALPERASGGDLHRDASRRHP